MLVGGEGSMARSGKGKRWREMNWGVIRSGGDVCDLLMFRLD